MKISLLVTSLLAASALTGFSQGTVSFNNLGITTTNPAGSARSPILVTPGLSSQVQGQPATAVANSAPNGSASYGAGAVGADGTGFSVELWAGANAGSVAVVPGSQTTMRSGAVAGYINLIGGSGTIAIPGFAGGTTPTLQVRAWDNNNNTITSWAAALAGSKGRGLSAPWQNVGLGDPNAVPPGLPAQMITPTGTLGWTTFNIFVVPEPSLIALGALGLGALLLRRRKVA